MKQNNKRQTYVCKRARMCSYLMEHGFQPYQITADRNDPSHEVFLFCSSPDLYKAVMDYIKKCPSEDGKISVRLSREDWLSILDALGLAEDDRIEQANSTMDNEDKHACTDAAFAYANIANAIQEQLGQREQMNT